LVISRLRALACTGACVLAPALGSTRAAAETIAMTSGNAGLYWDGSQTSFTISSADSRFMSEYFGSAKSGFNGGETVDFSTTIPVTNAGNHPLPETYHGQQFQAWVTGFLTITATPFVAPHASGDGSTFQSFSTTFTMIGTITAYATPDRAGTPLFSTDVSGGGTISAGPYRVVGDSYRLTSSEAFTFTPPAPDDALPSPWTSTDVGAVDRAGSSTYSGGVFTVSGSGADIWGSSDSFQFVSQPVNGNVDIVGRVTAEQNTHAFAKAGLTIRGSLAADSWHVLLDVLPGGGIEFMTRSQTASTTGFIKGTSSVFPVWLKLLSSPEGYVDAVTT